MAYILDTNCFIEAKNRYYGFDICPGFWEWLLNQSEAGVLYSIRSVKDELMDGNDELATWCRGLRDGFFLPNDDADTTGCFKDIATWVHANGFKPEHKALFLGKADPWIIAFAKAHGHSVITHEQITFSPHKVKIPNVCQQFSVPYMDLYPMLRSLGIRLVLP